MVTLHIKFKGITKCSSMVANILLADPSLTLLLGSKGQNERLQNMVTLHIKFKGITKCSSMVANILPADPSLTLRLGSKGQNYKKNQNMVMLHIKLKESRMQIFCPQTPPPPDPGDGVNWPIFNFFRTWSCYKSSN